LINLVIGLGDSETGETGETGEAGLKAEDGLTGIFGLFTGDTIPDFSDFAAFAAAHFRNNRALTSLLDPNNEVKIFFDNNLLGDPSVGYSESRGGALF
jgi:hypothetical protein